MRLKGKVAIITGGASGIGQATAELFSEEGAKVVVPDTDGKAGEATAQKIWDQLGTAFVIRADISKEDDARKISTGAVEALAVSKSWSTTRRPSFSRDSTPLLRTGNARSRPT